MKQYSIKVRKDGSGDTATITEAIELAKAMQQNAGEEEISVEINIGAGVYREKLSLEQNHVSLIGRSQDEVVIEYGDYGLQMLPDGVKRGTFRSQTIFIDGDDFTAKNLTFCNTAGFGAKVGQAVAVYADGAHMTFENCRFLGRQDTLFTAPLPPSVVEAGGFRGPRENAPRRNGVHYYKNCYIEGDVDFIFGGATAFFEDCEIRSLNRGEAVNGYVTAASTPEGREYGYVFDRCRFTSDCPPETVYLGRPWRSFAKTVIMNSELGAHIKKEGWHDWNKADAREHAFYAEYHNFGPGADTSERVGWSRVLTTEEAEHYTKEKVLGTKETEQMEQSSTEDARRFPRIDTYYTCLDSMRERFDVELRQEAFCAENAEEYVAWKRQTRKTLAELIGLPKMRTCDLKPELIESVAVENGIRRDKVVIQVEPDVYMPTFILVPEKLREGKVQCFLALPGHQGAGKFSVAGCYDIPAAKACIDKFHYDYGMQLAREGFVTFCPDCRGFGERRELQLQRDDESAFVNGSCYQLAHMAEPLGLTVTGMNTWDIMRLLDYIQTRTEWKTDRIGCLGFSGGGMQTLWAAALDDRIGVAVISGYLYGYKEALLERNGNCNCNYVPHLWEHVDMGDIGALLAPRPVLIQSCRDDHLNGARGLSNVTEQLDTMRLAYRLYEAEDRLLHEVCEGGHRWHEEHLAENLKKLGL